MRSVLDPVEPEQLRPAFSGILNEAQRGGVLKSYRYIDGYLIVTLDGTGQYYSGNISCPDCCINSHKNGDTSYYHQLLAAAIVHPDKKTVIPFAPEPIIKEHNATKNDCEFNASERLLGKLKEEHPRLKIIIVEDALYSKAPHIKLLNSLDYRYIIGVKENGHKYLFDSVQEKIFSSEDKVLETYNEKTKKHCGYRFINNLPLNKSSADVLVNFLEYWEIDEKGKNTAYFTWVTDIELTENNVLKIMRAGRARWKIENEVFNTLKNQGYHFGHTWTWQKTFGDRICDVDDARFFN